jgi:sugar (pentulose or hexulose) kinase
MGIRWGHSLIRWGHSLVDLSLEDLWQPAEHCFRKRLHERDSDISAADTVAWLRDQGYQYMVVDPSGQRLLARIWGRSRAEQYFQELLAQPDLRPLFSADAEGGSGNQLVSL